jgi:hypothetical protein
MNQYEISFILLYFRFESELQPALCRCTISTIERIASRARLPKAATKHLEKGRALLNEAKGLQ